MSGADPERIGVVGQVLDELHDLRARSGVTATQSIGMVSEIPPLPLARARVKTKKAVRSPYSIGSQIAFTGSVSTARCRVLGIGHLLSIEASIVDR